MPYLRIVLLVAKNLLWVSTFVCCLICGQNVVIEIMWCCWLECNDFWGMWNLSKGKRCCNIWIMKMIIFLVVMSMCSWHIRCPNACDASKDCHAGNMVNTIIIARKSLMCVMFHLDFFSCSANYFMTWQQRFIITLVFIAPWFYNPIVNSMRLVFILTFISLFGHWFSHFITSKWWI